MSINTGGPAFPQCSYNMKGGADITGGMTLRDWFAGMAMQGMLANHHPYQASDEHMFARDAYTVADAMLKARGASNGS